MERTGEFVNSVRAAIKKNFADRSLTIDRCATQLGISRRGMQRLLSESGLTFTRLVDEVRLELATRLLADDAKAIKNIAIELGFTRSANFARAFQRLSGVTPTEFRRRQQRAEDQQTYPNLLGASDGLTREAHRSRKN
jgi:AraC-like DNA-binding protein